MKLLFIASFLTSLPLLAQDLPCPDFTGAWEKVSCSNPAEEAPSVLPFNQISCETIGFDTFEIAIDGKTHSHGEFQYLANWDKPEILRISLDATVEQVDVNYSFYFSQKDSQKSLNLETKRTFAGETEVIQNCEYRLK